MPRLRLPLFKAISPDFVQAFRKLLADPASSANPYGLARSMSKIDAAQKDFNVARLALIKQHGKAADPKNEEGAYEIPAANMPAFQKAMASMLEDPLNSVELHIDQPIRLQDPLPKESKLTALDLYELECVIVAEDVKESPVKVSNTPTP